MNEEIPDELGRDLLRFLGYNWDWQLIKSVLNYKYGTTLNKPKLQLLYSQLCAEAAVDKI